MTMFLLNDEQLSNEQQGEGGSHQPVIRFPQIKVYNIHGHEIQWMSIFLNFLLGLKSCLFW